MMANTENSTIWDVDPIGKLIQKAHYWSLNKGLKSISVISEHPFEGKTMISMLLARGLSEVYNLKVLYIDLNPRGDKLINQYFGDYEFQDGVVKGHSFKFDIFRLKNLEIDWKKNIFDTLYLEQLVERLTAHYDIVVVDTMSNGKDGNYPLFVNTHTNVVVASKETFAKNSLKNFLVNERKNVLGVIFNK